MEYEVQGGIIKVIGLADLGLAEGVNDTIYDGCYQEDGDNYIDIIIVGDDAALRNLTHVEIPSLAEVILHSLIQAVLVLLLMRVHDIHHPDLMILNL